MSVNREHYESVIKRLVSAQTSKVVKREKGERIMKCLKGETCEGSNLRYNHNSPKFRFYVKKRGFEVFKTDIPGLGVEEHLFQKVSNDDESTSYRRVAFMEDFYDIIKQFHNHDTGNKRKNNSVITKRHCWKMIKERYTLFPKHCVDIFCNLCTICNDSRTEFSKQKYPRMQVAVTTEEALNSGYDMDNENDANDTTDPSTDLSVNAPVSFNPKLEKIKKENTELFSSSANITDVIVYENEIKAPKIAVIHTKSIQAKSFMELCQLELIEMDDMDQIYLYLGHFIDVYSNYHILFPLVNKSTAAIVQGLGTSVFSYFGIPKTLQSSHGPSFLIPIIDKIHIDWPNRGNCSLGNVSSNRSVHNLITFSSENEVKDIFKTLARENMINERHISWVKWIPLVQYRLNTQVEELGDPTAYQKVVKQLPRSLSICTIHRETDLCKVNSTPEVLETLSSVDKETSDITIDADNIVEINSSHFTEAEVTLVSAS